MGGHGLIAACASGCAASADLDGFESMWVRQALPCPTLKANFQYVRRKYVVELVLVLPPRDASALTGPLRVSWGEAANSEDGAYVQEEVLTLTNEHMQMHELIVDARRRRGGKRRKSGGGDMKEEAMVEEAYNETAAVPLLWLRVDPSLEWACRVAWSGRPREPLWSGMPEGMVRDQLQLDRCVASQLDAVAALTTFPTLTAINTLEVALRDDEVFYRVRAAAAAALCALVAPATNYEALHRLIKYARERLYDNGAVRPNDFTDLGEYFRDQSGDRGDRRRADGGGDDAAEVARSVARAVGRELQRGQRV